MQTISDTFAHGALARPRADLFGGRAPRVVLARGRDAAPEPAGGEPPHPAPRACARRTPARTRRLRAHHPELDLVIVTGNSADLAAAVAASQLDVAVLTLPVRGRQLVSAPFRVDPQVAIAAPDHRWPRRGALRPADLAELPLILYERGGTIRRVIDGWFQRGVRRPRVAMELRNAAAST